MRCCLWSRRTHGQLPKAGDAIDITWVDLALAAAALILVAVGISHWLRLGLARSFIVGVVRAVVQLVAIGYVLVYVVAVGRWWLVLLSLTAMLVVATTTATRRGGRSTPKSRIGLWTISGTSMFVSAGITFAYVTAVLLEMRTSMRNWALQSDRSAPTSSIGLQLCLRRFHVGS